MKKKGIFNKLLSLVLCILMLVACSNQIEKTDSQNESSISSTIEGSTSTAGEYDEDDYYAEWINQNPNYIKLDGDDITVGGEGASVKDGTVTITSSGVYVISGKLNDGQIVVDTEDKDNVRLVLNGAEVNCSDNSAIYVINSEKTIISLEDETENVLSDGTKYVLEDDSSDEPNSAIFSKSNLTINGTGSLNVKGNYNNGITSKDDLKITGGNITIDSADDALMGRDTVSVKDGNIVINAGGQGIKTTNDTDTEKGSIYVDGGTFSINSVDDAIHSINGINISNGEISITSEDDGIHADSFITIAGGTINVTKSYEGIESATITISGGDVNVIASDDGINVAGGNDSSSVNGRPGENNFSTNSTYMLTINGGNVSVSADGDGLDANGSIYMNGGQVIVNGPTSNGNGALDYDGEFKISGGVIMALGSSGMAQTASDTSTQNSVMVNFSEIQKSGTSVHLDDEDGKTVITLESEKEYQSLVISSPDLKLNNKYTLFVDDTSVVTFTLSKAVMKISDTGEEITGGGMGGMHGPGGGMENRGMQGDGKNPPEGKEGKMPPQNSEGSIPQNNSNGETMNPVETPEATDEN